jgi:hypothetical protein
VRPFGRRCLTVRTRLLKRKDFSAKFLERSVTQLSVRTTPTYITAVSHSVPQHIQVPCQSSGRSSHPIRTPICPLFHPSRRRVIPSGLQTDQHLSSERSVHSVWTPTLYREGSIQLASIWTFQQHVRTPLSTRSVFDFFPSSKKGKINQPSGRCGIPSGRMSP